MSESRSPILTLPERKRREADRRRAAVADMLAAMADFAGARAGRFLVFGSAAAQTLNARSDLDVIADFPATGEREALDFVEDLAERHRIPLDLHTLATTTPAFLAAIGPGLRVLP